MKHAVCCSPHQSRQTGTIVCFVTALLTLGLSASTPAWAQTNCERLSLTRWAQDAQGLATEGWLPLLLGTASFAVARPFDDDANRWVDGQQASTWTRVGDFSGRWPAQVAFIGGALLADLQDTCLSPLVHDLARAGLLDYGIVQSLKVSIRRVRPDELSPDYPERNSFPSGHTSSTFAFATVAHRHLGWRVGAPAYVLAAYTAWTRVRDDRHWVSDTVAGAAIGIALGRAVTRRDDAAIRASWQLAPVVSAREQSLVVTRTF